MDPSDKEEIQQKDDAVTTDEKDVETIEVKEARAIAIMKDLKKMMPDYLRQYSAVKNKAKSLK